MEKISFNNNWKLFTKQADTLVESLSQENKNEEKIIQLPHDGMIHEKRDKNCKNGGETGYYPGGTYTYKKDFFVAEEWSSKNIFFTIDGIQGISKILVNGNFVATFFNSYLPQQYCLNDYLEFGENNEIEIIVNNSLEQNSRWYTGSGIYRDVALYVADKTFIPLNGLRIRTNSCTEELAELKFEIDIQNDAIKKKLLVNIEIEDFDGKKVLSESYPVFIFSQSIEKISQNLYMKNPQLWSLENPYLYTVRVSLSDQERTIDTYTEKIGIRQIQVDPYNGLRINGKTVKLKGTCLHHDNGLLGAVCLEAAEKRKISQLKNAGFNSIRSSHNPMAPTTLKICDELGILVIDELTDVWNQSKNINDYSTYFEKNWERDVENMVRKDYNHPSVIFYSNGNEIKEAGNDYGARLNRLIVNKFHELDPSRPVTNGINGIVAANEVFYEILAELMSPMEEKREEQKQSADENINEINGMQAVLVGELADKIATHPKMNKILQAFADGLDIVGYNYLTGRHVNEHEKFPHRIILGTETFPADIFNLWNIVKTNNHVIGDFTWIGQDYLGEGGVGVYYYDSKRRNFEPEYPDRAAYIGDIDLIGNRRPISYYREIVYGLRKEPYLVSNRLDHDDQPLRTPWMWEDVVASWTWTGHEGEMAEVSIYSDAPVVELFLNGKSLGKKDCGVNNCFIAKYHVPYQFGQLKAVNYRNDEKAEEICLESAQKVEKIAVDVDKYQLRANGEDLAYIMIRLTDKEGRVNQFESEEVKINVEGVCQLAAFGSANPSCEGNYFDQQWKTYDGFVLAIIRAGVEEGTTNVKISIPGYEKVIRIESYKQQLNQVMDGEEK